MKKPKLAWSKGGGLIAAVVQERRTRRVLMVGWMNRAALELTLKSGMVTFYSRSRKKLWTKGETSGNVLRLVSLRADCDGDTLLVEAEASGPACHNGTATCFDGSQARAGALVGGAAFLEVLDSIVADRFSKRPRGSYVTGLIRGGLDRMSQKVGEEAVEVVIAAARGDRGRLESEAADLVFHLLVLLRAKGSSLSRVAGVLRDRHK